MLWGEPWGCFWGDPDEMIMSLDVLDVGDGPRVKVRLNPATYSGSYDYSQFVRLLVDGVPQGDYVWLAVGDTVELLGVWGHDSGDHVVSVQLNGDSSDTDGSDANQNDAFLATRADRIKVDVTAVPGLEAVGESGQLTAWSLTGLQRYTNVMPVDQHGNWAKLDVTLTNAAGVRTVTLKQNGQTIATGSRTGDGVVTLAESGSSGVTGSVTVSYAGDVTTGAYVLIRWPKYFAIHYKQSAFTAPDFPRTAEGTLVDDGQSNARTFRSAQLASGTWRVVAHQIDDNANESTGLAGGGDSVTLVTPPEPPTSLAYASGGAAATIVQWVASATSGATYNYYDSGETGIINLDTATGTHIAGTGTLTQTLPSVSGSFTGTRRVIVRAVYGGIIEGNAETLDIEYAAGQVVPARPPAPQGLASITLSGRTITVPVSVSLLAGAGTPAWLHLFARAVGGSFDYDSPSTVVQLGTAVGQAIVSKSTGAALTASYTHGSNALVEYALRTATAIASVVTISGDASAQTSAWTFTGQTGLNTNGGFLYWKLVDVAGTRTVSVYKDAAMASKVAEGSRVGDGAITLAAQGGSGLTGSVTVAYTVDDTDASNSLALNASSDNTDTYGPVRLSTTAPADPVQVSEAGV